MSNKCWQCHREVSVTCDCCGKKLCDFCYDQGQGKCDYCEENCDLKHNDSMTKESTWEK